MQINIFYYVFFKCADIILFQSALYAGLSISGVVERERMGTVFPHKKLSGNGVPTRELLRDIFLLLLSNLLFSLLPCYNTSHTSKYVKTEHQNLHIKTNFHGNMIHLYQLKRL